jgi:hypothetical protein
MIRFELNIVCDDGQRQRVVASARRGRDVSAFQSERQNLHRSRRVSFRGGIGFSVFCPRCAGRKEVV